MNGRFGFEIRLEGNLDFHFLKADPEAGAGVSNVPHLNYAG